MRILNSIPFSCDETEVFARLRMKASEEWADDVRLTVAKAAAVARPKAVFRESFIERRDSQTVTIDGVTFTSRVLCSNLEAVERVFPFVTTCGTEIDALPLVSGDVFEQFCRDTIKELALAAALRFLSDYLREAYALPKITSMHPGSGDRNVWPIEQQKLLFHLLGDGPRRIGVVLTETCLMIPNKSISGIFYPAAVDFSTCRLCHRPNCPSRRAPFDAHLWEERFPEEAQRKTQASFRTPVP